MLNQNVIQNDGPEGLCYFSFYGIFMFPLIRSDSISSPFLFSMQPAPDINSLFHMPVFTRKALQAIHLPSLNPLLSLYHSFHIMILKMYNKMAMLLSTPFLTALFGEVDISLMEHHSLLVAAPSQYLLLIYQPHLHHCQLALPSVSSKAIATFYPKDLALISPFYDIFNS